MSTAKTITSNIRGRLAAARLTQDDLADRLSLSRASINKYLRCVSPITPDRLDQIAAVLEVPAIDLYADEEGLRALNLGREILADKDLHDLYEVCKTSPDKVRKVIQLLID